MSKIFDPVEVFMDRATPSREVPERFSVWSIDEIRPYMGEVAFKGKGYRLIDTNAWVQPGKQEVNVPLPDNPTWHDLWEAVDKAIEQSGDTHHVFIEGFEVNRRKKTVEMLMGS